MGVNRADGLGLDVMMKIYYGYGTRSLHWSLSV
jgi:hypothetical protein